MSSITVTRYAARITPARKGIAPYVRYFSSLETFQHMEQGWGTTSLAGFESLGEIVHTFRVGDRVQTSAFGRMRNGVVVKVNRTTLTIELVRNQQGDLHTGNYPATSAYPSGSLA